MIKTWRLFAGFYSVCNGDILRILPVEHSSLNKLFHALDDPMPPFHIAKQIAEKIPNVQFIQINSGGHLLIGHHERVQSKIRSFITENMYKQELLDSGERKATIK